MPDKDEIQYALRNVCDPEIRVNILDVGLIYNIDINHSAVRVEMTLTSPNCPASEQLKQDVVNAVYGCSNVDDVELELVWDPPWEPSRMSEEARLELGYDI